MLPVSERVAEQLRSVSQKAGGLTRAFSVVFAVVALLLVSPLLGGIALAIKLDDGAPIFYGQVRVGRGFRCFRLWKLRTMIEGADGQGLLTAPADARITKVGHFLRRYKLDELPQLWNVVRGDMELVGARPEVERYVQMFHAQYAVLLQQRPGMTDPASLAYRREEQMFSPGRMEEQYVSEILPSKLKLSQEYQERRTLLSDMRILLQTVFALLD